MPDGIRVSIVVIGDEILGGFVADTNSGWLASRLQTLGFPLDRVSTVPDSFEAISEALETELGRARPRLILTSGGIGSTPDDLTFEAVARHLGTGLRIEPLIDERITAALAWTASQGVDVTPEHERSMRKMSLVPQTARVLLGSAGLLPGVAVDVDGGCGVDSGATIVVMPGVPTELRRIFDEGVVAQILLDKGVPQHVEELAHPYPESILNPVLDRLVVEFPDVHLGSYPGRECTVRVKGPRDRVQAAMELVRGYLDELAKDPGAAKLSAAWQARWAERAP